MNDSEYRKSSEEVKKAYFEYREKYGTDTTSVVSFVAGWNAARKKFSDKSTEGNKKEFSFQEPISGAENINLRCQQYGHEWYRHEYVGIGDVNYLTCTRCGAEKTD